MNRQSDRKFTMGLQDFFNWRSQTVASSTADVADDEPVAEADEPPDHHSSHEHTQPDFHKSIIRAQIDRKESLLTKALLKDPENETSKPEIQIISDLSRRRSMISNASMASASTAELTSDGGLTSPARTNTPSPPPPNATYESFAPYSITSKPVPQTTPIVASLNTRDSTQIPPELLSASPKTLPPPTVIPKKRCITFACGGKNVPSKAVVAPAPTSEPTQSTTIEAPQPRVCRIKFACPGPKASETVSKALKEPESQVKVATSPKKSTAQSSSIPRKSPRATLQPSPRPHRDSSSTIRRASQSPVAVRVKPKYIIADEKTLRSSEATRFHEFASEEPQEDDWIRRDTEVPRAKLTINDTLKMENAIRQLGNEAEEEALEEDEEDDEENDSGTYFDDDNSEEDDEENDDDSIDGSGDDASDGNETDNEAGFAESDDETDGEGEFSFWTPGRNMPYSQVAEASTFRPSAHRAASPSSIDSVGALGNSMGYRGDRRTRRRPIKIRPGTPELPDSTDFVCGTLDEDRPIENAYISCMEARKIAKHKQTPQDIDPSFPTSDIEDEEDENDVVDAHDSDEHVWLHGKFEESDHEGHGRRRSTTTRRKSPITSPKRIHSPPPPNRRLHSPPPPKQRLRSPPPRKLFGHSPKRMRSPPPAKSVRSPAASPTHTASQAINFAPLASRPGLTHTKSLPRAPNAFGRQYRASRIEAATGNGFDNSDVDGHIRGAIDIVKGLEQKRQRRKEKFLQKQNNRGRKNHSERKPQPGKGAERMRELGLLMAGKAGAHNPYMLSA
jgi:hypothetical protein